MAIEQLSAGVQVKEIDLTNVVRSASSSIGAYVGDFTWGPIEEITTISREKQLIDVFGKPTKFKATDFTALSLFLKYTDHAEVVRMVDSAARNATADTISGGRLIKNREHFDGLTGTLSATTTVTLNATANGKAQELQITVDDASGITGGDIITGTGIAAGTTVAGITGNVITLSQPLEGVIPTVTKSVDIVEVYGEKEFIASFAAGSNLLQTTDVAVEWQPGAVASHYDPAGGVASFANNTIILPAASDFVVGDVLTGTVAGPILSINTTTGEVVVDVVAPGYVVGETVTGATAGTAIVGSTTVEADITFDPAVQYMTLSTQSTYVTLLVGEAATFNVGDVIIGGTSGVTGTITVVDTANDIITVATAGSTFTPGETITGGTGTGTVQLSVVGVNAYAVGDTVTGATSGATGLVQYIDTVNHVMHVGSAIAFTVGEAIVGGSVAGGFGTVGNTSASAAANFVLGDTVTGVTSTATGVVSAINGATNTITVTGVTGVFAVAETVNGGSTVFGAGTSTAVAFRERVILRRVADGSIKLASVLSNNIAATERVVVSQTAVLAADTVIGSFTIDVVDASFLAVGDEVVALGIPDGARITAIAPAPAGYATAQPATVSLDYACTDVIPAGQVVRNNRIVDLSTTTFALGQQYFVLSDLNGVVAGDEVDHVVGSLTGNVAQIPAGTEIHSIDTANNVVRLNQPISAVAGDYLLSGTMVKISRRVNVTQDALAEATVIYVDNVSSVAVGDIITDITGSGLAPATTVASVDIGSGAITLSNPLTGVIPTVVNIADPIVVDVYRGPWYAKYAGVLGNSLKVEVCGSAAAYATWAYKGYFTTAPGTSDFVSARAGSNDEMHIIVIDEEGKFTGVPGSVLETFSFLSQASDARLADGTNNYYVDVINDRSNYLYWGAHLEALVDAGSEAQDKIFTQLPGISSVRLTEGVDSGSIGVAEWAVGFELFRDVETIIVDFLIQPSIPNSPDGKVVQDLLIDIAEFRTDCMAILSPPVELTAYGALNPVANVVAWFDQINSTSYAVFDSSSIKVYDKVNDQYLMLPAASSIAGLCARTDDTNAPWFSPAGYNRGQLKGVVKLGHIPRKTERDQLYSARINPLATFPGEGTVLYGDKTALAKPSAFDRINVRRLFITLERAISNASKYMLFEFNDEITRNLFIAMVEPYLRNVQGLRGITDFHVVCDETNNTPYIIDTNQFVGDIYIKPTRSINFITLNFIAVRTGVSFQEIATGLYE